MDTVATTIEQTRPAAVIDQAHLTKATFGDSRLQRDVLLLFDRQVVLLMARIRNSAPAAVGSHAHTLKGSAAGIGAWAVVTAAEAVERASATSLSECDRAITGLATAVDEARGAIAEMLRAP